MPSTSAIFLSSRYRHHTHAPAPERPALSVRQRTAHAQGVSNMREIYFLERIACARVLPRSDSTASLRSYASDSSSSGSHSSASSSRASWDPHEVAEPPGALFARTSALPMPAPPTAELFDIMLSSRIMFMRNGAYDADAFEHAIAAAKAPPAYSRAIFEPEGTGKPTLRTPRADPATPKPLSAPRPPLQSMRKYSLSEIIADASLAHAPKIPRAHLVYDAPPPPRISQART